RLSLVQRAFRQIALDIDIQEAGGPTQTHRSAILLLNRGQIPEVQPLNGFTRRIRRLGDDEAIGGSHLLQFTVRANLLGQLLAQTNDILAHDADLLQLELLLLIRNEEVYPIESNPAIVADDPAAAVRIRQACDDPRSASGS